MSTEPFAKPDSRQTRAMADYGIEHVKRWYRLDQMRMCPKNNGCPVQIYPAEYCGSCGRKTVPLNGHATGPP